jgi:hypothetical protein
MEATGLSVEKQPEEEVQELQEFRSCRMGNSLRREISADLGIRIEL